MASPWPVIGRGERLILRSARCPDTIAPSDVSSDKPKRHSSSGDSRPRIRLVMAQEEVLGNIDGSGPKWPVARACGLTCGTVGGFGGGTGADGESAASSSTVASKGSLPCVAPGTSA